MILLNLILQSSFLFLALCFCFYFCFFFFHLSLLLFWGFLKFEDHFQRSKANCIPQTAIKQTLTIERKNERSKQANEKENGSRRQALSDSHPQLNQETNKQTKINVLADQLFELYLAVESLELGPSNAANISRVKTIMQSRHLDLNTVTQMSRLHVLSRRGFWTVHTLECKMIGSVTLWSFWWNKLIKN